MGHSEQEQIRESLQHLLAGSSGPGIRHALVETGWFELLEENDADALRPLFSLQGELLVEASAMLHVAMSQALPATVAGDDPSVGVTPLLDGTSLATDRRRWYCIGPPEDLPPLVTWLPDAGIVRIDEFAARPVSGLDPSLGLFEVEAPVGGHDVLLDGAEAAGAWTRSQAIGRRALAEELLGAAGVVLRMSVEHARDRRQFGRPIGSFQAIQHKLADAHIALTAAGTAVEDAWADAGALTTDLAKAWAGRAGRVVVAHGQQTLGGIGFTLEHPFHRFARRVHVLDALGGSSAALHRATGEKILADRAVPRLGSL